ncbi:MAG: hypothetical protein M1490_03240 [Candidatus Bathyarchaeota archaeon]|nr:hypothetical protein [Candidatus Bathyarchaeota archaeon]
MVHQECTSITVTCEVYDKIEKLAKEDNRSVKKEAEYLILNAHKNREKLRKKAKAEAL